MQGLQLNEDRQWVGLGDQVEITGERQRMAGQQAAKDMTYAEKAEVHLWAVMVAHRASDQMLDAFDGVTGDLPMLDAETLLMPPGICCLVCEQPYERLLRKRKCPGEPKAGKR